ncbi:MAG TPA: hypothetical protein VF018_08330 [Acidobacteriaceae bacterium]
MNTEQIVAALDAEIARLRLARTMIEQSAATKIPSAPGTSISDTGKAAKPGKSRRRELSAEARERIAAAQRKRWAEQKKSAIVAITRVPAKEAPKRRAPKPVAKPETPLTANIPDGPVAVPREKLVS